MGCGSSRGNTTDPPGSQGRTTARLAGREIDQLESETRFSKDELELLSRRFYDLADMGEVTRAKFGEVMSSAGLPSYSAGFLDRVFEVFDVDHSGTVSLKELCTGLSVLSYGTAEEKLTMSFNVYDINGDGKISPEEFIVLLSSLEQGMMLTGKANVSDVVAQFLRDFDINDDDAISLFEFKLAALREPLFRGLLEPDDLHSTQNSSAHSHVSAAPSPSGSRGRRARARDSHRSRACSLSSCSEDMSSNAVDERGRAGMSARPRRRKGGGSENTKA